jgi:hypothetical protein
MNSMPPMKTPKVPKTSYVTLCSIILAVAVFVLLSPAVLQASDWLSEEKVRLALESRQYTLPALRRTDSIIASRLADLQRLRNRPASTEEMLRIRAQVQRELLDIDHARVRKAPKPLTDRSTLGQSPPSIDYEQICRETTQADADVVTPSGDHIRMLTYALVFNERGRGAAMFGHVMQRFDYCRNNVAVSLIFNEGPSSSDTIAANFSNEYRHLGLTDAQISQAAVTQKNTALFTWIIGDISKLYQERQITDKRGIHEAHLELPGIRKYLALLINMKRFVRQGEDFLEGNPLPGYNFVTNSCLRGFTDTIDRIIPFYSDAALHLLPTRLYGYTTKRFVERVIVFPSNDSVVKQ